MVLFIMLYNVVRLWKSGNSVVGFLKCDHSSLRSRRKRGTGKEARTQETNGGLGASPQTPIFPFPVYTRYAGCDNSNECYGAVPSCGAGRFTMF